tara:strand:- start:69 stop:248 length:180 start_codon:yes stop_codon:yes gene_type:complete
MSTPFKLKYTNGKKPDPSVFPFKSPAKKVEIDMDLMREVGAHQVKKPEKSTLETIVAAM